MVDWILVAYRRVRTGRCIEIEEDRRIGRKESGAIGGTREERKGKRKWKGIDEKRDLRGRKKEDYGRNEAKQSVNDRIS